MQDVIDRLDAELGRAPDPTFDVAATVAAGRRTVRRRRIAASTAALAIAVAVGGAAWAVAPGSSGPSQGQAAVDPPASATPTPTTDAGPAWGPDEVLRIEDDGRVSLNPAAELIDSRTFLEGGEAFHVALGDEEYYALASVDDSISTQRLPAQGLGLVEWANAQSVVAGGGGAVEEDWVAFDGGSSVVAVLDGLTVVRQLPDPGLGPNFAGPGDPSALAEVLLDGATYFLAVRSIGGGPAEGISYRRDDQVSTLEQFRTFARAQYATNDDGGSEGLR